MHVKITNKKLKLFLQTNFDCHDKDKDVKINLKSKEKQKTC